MLQQISEQSPGTQHDAFAARAAVQAEEHAEEHADELLSKVEPIRGLRRGMMKSMTAAANIAQLGLADDVNMDKAVALRRQIATQLQSTSGLKFTYMPLFLKATSLALLQFPILNASVDMDSESVVYHEAHNISVAMATRQGLIVPNIKHVEQLSMVEIAQELQRLGEVAKSGKFAKEDLDGGSFSLSNIGSIGGTVASPVVFPPQVAIGAIGSIQKRPVVGADGSVNVASMLSISWAADHRVIDGATLALFSKEWKQYIEAPEHMLLNMK